MTSLLYYQPKSLLKIKFEKRNFRIFWQQSSNNGWIPMPHKSLKPKLNVIFLRRKKRQIFLEVSDKFDPWKIKVY
ncbi:hypothetical protein [Circoviridae sp.]|nr:hypothetical protein [Circoviridae sp.]